jgi:hypothetical protein
MKILLVNFSAEIGSREDIFKPTIWNDSLHEISNDNEISVVYVATPKNLTVKSTMFPHYSIHKYTNYSGQQHVIPLFGGGKS